MCVTGAEALFADLGHFNRAAIRLASLGLVYPALILTYLGQAAYLTVHPENVRALAFYNARSHVCLQASSAMIPIVANHGLRPTCIWPLCMLACVNQGLHFAPQASSLRTSLPFTLLGASLFALYNVVHCRQHGWVLLLQVSTAFWSAIPNGLFYPMFIVATLSAVIASQALISAVFQIFSQAITQGFLPRLQIYHTSKQVLQAHVLLQLLLSATSKYS